MKITQFDKPTIRVMRPAIEKALATLEEQFGIKVTVGNARFSETNVTFKFEMSVIGEGGEAETKEATAFKKYAQLYNLQPTDLGRRFVSGGREYIITGLRVNAPKRPILAKGAGGKTFIFPASTVCLGLSGGK